MLNTRSSPEKFGFADGQRGKPTPAEAALWEWLGGPKSRYSDQMRFGNQILIYGFVADFYCPSRRVVVEADGGIHDRQRDYDVWRKIIMRKRAEIATIRFTNEEILKNPCNVAEKIFAYCRRREVYPISDADILLSRPNATIPKSGAGWEILINEPPPHLADRIVSGGFARLFESSAWTLFCGDKSRVQRIAQFCGRYGLDVRISARIPSVAPGAAKQKNKQRDLSWCGR